jgi:hypothetical protein
VPWAREESGCVADEVASSKEKKKKKASQKMKDISPTVLEKNNIEAV